MHMLALPFLLVADPWWQKPEWITGLSTAALVLFGLIDYWQKRRDRHLRIQKAAEFDPNEIVCGFRATGFSEYLSVPFDNEIWSALLVGESLGLRGRPGIGKSHSAAFHIRRLGLSAHAGRHRILWWLQKRMSALGVPGMGVSGDWYVVRPPLQALQVASHLRVRKRRYILLLDDLDDYVRNDDGAAVLDLISSFKSQAESLVVISTLRSTAPEDDSITAVSKIFGRWKWIDLPDWQLEQGMRLAQRCGVGAEKWDGTPLSVKQPSSEMRKKYHDLPDPAAKAILRCLLLFRDCGLSSISRAVLKNVCATDIFEVSPLKFEPALAMVNRFGFLKAGAQFVESYAPYLEVINDWAPSLPSDYLVLRDLLVKEQRVAELMTIALRWYGKGSFSEAEWICRKCIELAPRSPYFHSWLGSILRKKGDLIGAESAYKIALKLNPNYSRVRSLLAAIWYKLGRIEDAEKVYRSLIKAHIQIFEALIGFGMLLLQKGDFVGAELQFHNAIRLRPSSARARCFLGESFWRLNRLEDAERSYTEAIELDSQLPEARIGYARLLLERRHYTAAAREAQQATRLMPRSAWAHALLGDGLRGLQKLDEAEASYRTAILLETDSIEYKLGLGIVLLEAGKYSGARDMFSSVVNADPTSWRAYSYLGEALALLRDFDEAEKSYVRACQIEPMMTEPLTGLGMTLLKKGDFSGAEEVFVKALRIKPGSPWVYARLGDALRRQEKFDEAEEMYGKALSADPEMLRLRYNHGIALLRHGDYSRAELAFRDVLQFDAENLAALSGLAEALIRQGKNPELETVKGKFIQVGPKHAAIYIGPGMSALGCENWSIAEYFFRKAIDIEPENARAHQHLGDALLHLKQFDEAATVLRRAVRLNFQMSKAHYLLGKTFWAKNDFRKAETSLRTSIKIKNTFAGAHNLLGDVLERTGRREEAAEEQRIALDLQHERAEGPKQT